MAEASLMNHRGAREVTLNELALIEAPPPTDTWFPVSHFDVWRAVDQTLQGAGYAVRKQTFSVARDNNRFFGVLDLESRILDGISLAVGIRNSVDKSFPIGMTVGSRVFVCDNLAFHGEIVIAKKHTRFGQERYREGISKAVASLGHYQEAQAQWIGGLSARRLTVQESDSIILQAFDQGVISSRTLPLILEERRKPSFIDFDNNTAWALYNHFTRAIGISEAKRSPAKAAHTTIRLQKLFNPEVIDVEFTRKAEWDAGGSPATEQRPDLVPQDVDW